MTKINIQGLDEDPTAVIVVLKREMPEVAYILCADFQLEHVAESAESEYKEPNEVVIKKFAETTKTKVVFKKCNVFDPTSVGDAFGEVLKEIKPTDDIGINYSTGTATVKLILGTAAVVLSKFLNIRILYADALALIDHTDALKNFFKLISDFY